MNGEKAFVVAPDLETYAGLVRYFRLEPGLAFYCASVNEAAFGVFENLVQGIAAAMWTAEGRWQYCPHRLEAA
jgi:hypothetical protein